MPVHLQREIERLKRQILSLCAIVENNFRLAVKAVAECNSAIAAQVIDGDLQIDQAEIDVEEDCLKILALHQPVAIDLRYIVAVLKMNNDLERIGDLAVNIAKRAQYLSSHMKIDIPCDFKDIAQKTQAILRSSLDALMNMDADLALQVCSQDDEVDAVNRRMYNQVKDMIRAHPEQVDSLIALLSVSRCLERIADHATNIAEDVLYMIQGQIVRHVGKLNKDANS